NYSKIPLTKGKRLHRKRFDDIEIALQWLHENPDSLVELTLITDEYLRSEDRKTLLQSHNGIVTIIPEVRNMHNLESRSQTIDLSQGIEDLFKQYFQSRYGQEVNPELLELFKEVRAEQKE